MTAAASPAMLELGDRFTLVTPQTVVVLFLWQVRVQRTTLMMDC